MPSLKPRYIDVQAHPDLRAVVCDYGASVYQIYYRGVPMLHVGDKKDFETPNAPYWGQFVAPVAGRIPGGISHGFALPKNEGDNSLHSGNASLCWKPFSVIESEEKDATVVLFEREDELCGNRYVAFSEYRFNRDEPSFTLTMGVRAIDDCLCNVTNHMYWNLGEEDARNVTLRFDADRRMEYGPRKEPLQFVDAIDEYDFRQGKRPWLGIDTAFAGENGEFHAESKRFSLTMRTDAPAVIIYLDLVSHSLVGHPRGFTLECVRHPEVRDIYLPAGKEERIQSTYSFSSIG